MEKVFLPLYYFFKNHRAAFYICLVLSFAAVGFFASKVRFVEDISAVLPKDATTDKLNTVFQNSKFLDRLVIHVQTEPGAESSPDSLVAFAEAYVQKAKADLPEYIESVNDKVDDDLVLGMFNNVQEQLPVYLGESDYTKIDSLTDPSSVQKTLANNIKLLSSPSGYALKQIIVNDPLGISFIGLKKLQQLQYDENYELYDGYIVTKDHRHLLLFISPAYKPNNTDKNEILLNGLDAINDSLRASGFEHINAAYYGSTAVSAGNALQIRKDNLVTQGIAVAFIIIFIAWYFRRLLAPLVMLLPVAFGALFSLAIIYFSKGSISVIALGTGSVVLGIAINYSLHVFNHYRHTQDIRTVLQDLSTPMTIGSFTTIGGFLCLQFVHSDLLKDVGLFAAISLIGASLFSLIFLPHLLGKPGNADVQTRHSIFDKLALQNPEKNKWIIIGIVLLTGGFAYTSRYASFETDMMRLNYMTPKLKEAEKNLNAINAYALQSVYLLASGKNLDEALMRNESASRTLDSLQETGVIQKYSGPGTLLMSQQLQQQRIDRWNAYWTPTKKAAILNDLRNEGKTLGYSVIAFNNFDSLLSRVYTAHTVQQNSDVMNGLSGDYIIDRPGEIMIVNIIKTKPENKAAIYNAFNNEKDITTVDKQYLTNKLVEAVNADFTSIAVMSSLLVFIVLLVTYGRIEMALATFIPMLITWIWILGLMGIFGIQFNIVNIIISTLIFGLGDDYSIFIMDGLQQEYKTGKKLLASYKSSILLSAVTTITGLGVLIFAKHPALRSIALISIIGMFCVVMMSQILIPFFFNLLVANRVKKKKFPWTFTSFLKSCFAFSYFILGCLLLNILGLLLIRIRLLGRKKSKVIYHKVLSSFAWSLMYIMANVKKTVINPHKEDFKKPAVIIANHQSFLDILSTIMLYPKLILLTNEWVYHSPFFGSVVRMAGYYPVKEGAEQSIEKLASDVAEGYSIVVFPEGTRSADGKMKRFHKGAFYLAETLNIDILPILVHGSGYTMSKNDFLLKDGDITLEILPRIAPDDHKWGDQYAARTKRISAYFRQEYHELSRRKETVDFYRETLHYNYLYKGPVLEWYMRIKVSLEKNYRRFDALVPKRGKVLDVGCGYGFLCYMLHFTSPERQITGIDYDEEKVATAAHCFSNDAGIDFFYSDALDFAFETYDCIILSDILHYLDGDSQQKLMVKCIKHLQANGTIIIRDGNAELKHRHRGTRLSEFFSTKLLGFNKTSADGLSFLQADSIYKLATQYNMQVQEVDESRLTSNIIFVLKSSFPGETYDTRN